FYPYSVALCRTRTPRFQFTISSPPRSPLFPYTTLFRSSAQCSLFGGGSPDFAVDGALRRGRGLLASPHRLCGDGGSQVVHVRHRDRKSTRLNSSHVKISYAVFCLKKKTKT